VACLRVAAEWAAWVVWISKSDRTEHNNRKGPAAMPGLLRWYASHHLERLEDETDQFGIQSKRRSGHLFIAGWNEDAWYHWPQVDSPTCISIGSLSQHLQRTTKLKLPRLHRSPHAVDDRCYRFFFFPKMSFQLSL
jgi:hypothetical protein